MKVEVNGKILSCNLPTGGLIKEAIIIYNNHKRRFVHILSFITRSKGKVVPVLNYAPRPEDAWGSGGIASFLTSALDGSEIRFTPRLFYPWRKSPRYTVYRRLGRSQCGYRRC
jgi:hypothetical protein